MSSNRQNSRFSTLKVFKFASAARPPPPPPKDPYYLPNHSLASLSQTLPPETFTPPFATNPNTPMSAGYASSARSPSPSPSYTPSFAPSQASQAPSCYDLTRTRLGPSTTSLSPPSANSRKGFSFKFGSLGKRPKTPKSPASVASGDLPPETADDPSISMPWNFQVRGPPGLAYGLASLNTSLLCAAQRPRRRGVRLQRFYCVYAKQGFTASLASRRLGLLRSPKWGSAQKRLPAYMPAAQLASQAHCTLYSRPALSRPLQVHTRLSHAPLRAQLLSCATATPCRSAQTLATQQTCLGTFLCRQTSPTQL